MYLNEGFECYCFVFGVFFFPMEICSDREHRLDFNTMELEALLDEEKHAIWQRLRAF